MVRFIEKLLYSTVFLILSTQCLSLEEEAEVEDFWNMGYLEDDLETIKRFKHSLQIQLAELGNYLTLWQRVYAPLTKNPENIDLIRNEYSQRNQALLKTQEFCDFFKSHLPTSKEANLECVFNLNSCISILKTFDSVGFSDLLSIMQKNSEIILFIQDLNIQDELKRFKIGFKNKLNELHDVLINWDKINKKLKVSPKSMKLINKDQTYRGKISIKYS